MLGRGHSLGVSSSHPEAYEAGLRGPQLFNLRVFIGKDYFLFFPRESMWALEPNRPGLDPGCCSLLCDLRRHFTSLEPLFPVVT